MIATLSWLKKHLKTSANLNQIVEKLTSIGLEVEEIKQGVGELSHFKIAKIIKAQKHPNADKLKLCEVSIGKGDLIKVVCGAKNARDGLITVYAPPGTTIPKSKIKIEVAKIRGVESFGMLCSESELNISNESEGIIELNNKSRELGKNYFKGNGEKSINIAVTPNRPDCLGIRGIARDLSSAGVGSLINEKKIKFKQSFSQPIKISIKKENNQGCMSFGTCYIKNIKNKQSPNWLKEKIVSLGLKPISAVVDVTNYVMFDLNRPLHAYDADKINKEIIVRSSKPGENFTALDNKNYKLLGNMCVITDKSGILGLGGIIGGDRSSTESNTKNVLLEAAYFYPSSIRKTANLLNIDTDAKYRFERGIDPNSITEGLQMAANLILNICGGQASKFSVSGKSKVQNKTIKIENTKFKKTIGISISANETKKIFNSLGFKIKNAKKSMKVEIPSWRPDITSEIDLIEELIRIKGFENIKIIHPKRERLNETLNFRQKIFHLSQRSVASKGYLEAVTWSFTDKEIEKLLNQKTSIEIQNPISSDLNVLRSSIFSNLILYVKKNQDRGYHDFSIFEIGPTFFGKKPGEQKTVLGGLRSGMFDRKNWNKTGKNFDVFDVKTDTIKTLLELGLKDDDLIITSESRNYYHPGRSGSIRFKSESGPRLAYFGEIHPRVTSKLDLNEKNLCGFELFIDSIPQSDKKLRVKKQNYLVSAYQKSERDFAFVIDKSFKAGEVEKMIRSIDTDIIKNVKTFDVFEGQNLPEGKKSLAINVTLQSFNKTLTESDLDSISKKIIDKVKNKTGATIRS